MVQKCTFIVYISVYFTYLLDNVTDYKTTTRVADLIVPIIYVWKKPNMYPYTQHYITSNIKDFCSFFIFVPYSSSQHESAWVFFSDAAKQTLDILYVVYIWMSLCTPSLVPIHQCLCYIINDPLFIEPFSENTLLFLQL